MAPSNGSACASMLMPPKRAYSNWLPLFLVNISFSAKPPAKGYPSSLTDNHPTGPTHISIKLCCQVRAEKPESESRLGLIIHRKEPLLAKQRIYSIRQHLYNFFFQHEPIPYGPR